MVECRRGADTSGRANFLGTSLTNFACFSIVDILIAPSVVCTVINPKTGFVLILKWLCRIVFKVLWIKANEFDPQRKMALYFFMAVTASYILLAILGNRFSYRFKNKEHGQIFRYVSVGGLSSMYIGWSVVFLSQLKDIYVPDLASNSKSEM